MPAAETTATFAGIHNENEFYSHHYLSEVFAGDIREIVERWRDAAANNSPTTVGRTPYGEALPPEALLLKGEFYVTAHWNETMSQREGIICRETRFPETPAALVLSGPHFFERLANQGATPLLPHQPLRRPVVRNLQRRVAASDRPGSSRMRYHARKRRRRLRSEPCS